MECIVHHLGLALGGRPAASFAERLMMPVSNDTLLRVVRRRAQQRDDPLRAVGIDDFAFRRNHRYGSIVCDLERRQIVKLLPDREIATVAAWLADHRGDPDRLSRWRRLWRGSGARPAGSGSGRGPMAPDGERQRGLSRRGEEVDEADPRRARSDDYLERTPF